ncbi:FecR domain-containing protein [Janthinobacterium aquaticum]|uniref:FecR domain-containing protein n=1 Tax=Janthinobacterium sp. FT58W TaxID=2654254 RepID=UPI00186B4621|nr:FecR domain-containing protein [Janthinobacterium sp. FT58W]
MNTTIDPRAAREAAQWLVRLHEVLPGSAEQRAFEAWRASDPAHAAAWARAELVCRTLAMVPPALRAPAGDAAPVRQRRVAIKRLALLIAGVTPLWLASRSAPWQAFRAQTRTATGEIRHLVLPDGTQLVLNTATAIDVAFDSTARLVTLHAGEVHVQTGAKPAGADPALSPPLIIRSSNGSVRAIGTRFTVRQDEALLSPRTHVAVSDGAVEITPVKAQGAASVLRQGWQLSFDEHAPDPAMPLAPDADAWRDGLLVARRTPLGQVAAQLARYRQGVVRCHPGVAQLAVDGIFQLNDTDRILQLLQMSLPVRVRLSTRYWVSIEPV